MKEEVKLYLLIGVIVAIFTIIGMVVFNVASKKTNLSGGGQLTVNQTLIGTVDNLNSLPITYYEGASTSTAGYTDGSILRQELGVDGITQLSISGLAKGGTATSSILIKPMISLDGTNFFNITGNSSSTDSLATTTGGVVGQVFSFDPGTATSSFSYILNIPPAKELRLIIMGENVSTDSNDGVKAFIQVGLEQGY